MIKSKPAALPLYYVSTHSLMAVVVLTVEVTLPATPPAVSSGKSATLRLPLSIINGGVLQTHAAELPRGRACPVCSQARRCDEETVSRNIFSATQKISTKTGGSKIQMDLGTRGQTGPRIPGARINFINDYIIIRRIASLSSPGLRPGDPRGTSVRPEPGTRRREGANSPMIRRKNSIIAMLARLA